MFPGSTTVYMAITEAKVFLLIGPRAIMFIVHLKYSTFRVVNKNQSVLSIRAHTAVSPMVDNTAIIISPMYHGPFEKVAIDFIGPFQTTAKGNKYILTMLDTILRWPSYGSACVPPPL